MSQSALVIKSSAPLPLFLQLPGEIRNIIYAYMFTQEKPRVLHFVRREARFNQLQYVCKQLQQEAGHLELKYNPTIKITGTLQRSNTATDRLLRFIDTIPPAKRRFLRYIILQNRVDALSHISDELPEMRWTQLRLDSFCTANPHVRIHYVVATTSAFHLLRDFRGDIGMGIIALAWLITSMFRPVPIPILWPYDTVWRMGGVSFSEVRDVVWDWAGSVGGEEIRCLGSSNIRFFPMADAFMNRPFSNTMIANFLKIYTGEALRQGVLPQWERIAMCWYEHGF